MLILFSSSTFAGSISYSFASLPDFAGPMPTPYGINNSGQIVGTIDGSGFSLTGGAYSGISGPVSAVNNSGEIVGSWTGTGNQRYGVFYSSASAAACNLFLCGSLFTTGAYRTLASGINDAGVIVGYSYEGNSAASVGFQYAGGTFTAIAVPGASATFVSGINNSGEIVGTFTDSSGAHGFLDNGGTFTTIDYGTDTNITGINNHGDFVGYYSFANGVDRSFVSIGGIVTTVDFWGGVNNPTYAYGINDQLQIVGSAAPGRLGGGFLATPDSSSPEPAPALLVATGATLCLLLRKRLGFTSAPGH